MKAYQVIIIGLMAQAIILGCGEKRNEDKSAHEVKNEAFSEEVKDSEQTLADSVNQEKDEPREMDNFDMLQGKWQSINDASSYLVFHGDRRKEITLGLENELDEKFSISNNCESTSDSNGAEQSTQGNYIRVAESDMCWYIIKLNADTLSMSYVGRGNTLTYKKVKNNP
ncbi:hypothetical protein [Fulvivirga sediminis]|uniref:Uncharacterized protein n=1 Tax=Fulvivirga sediminis TaxID=2803949 RepID=A0A937FDJ3_9BACT|nr:hypothetical protein [Fulvivirga sediminis]MBL3658935.1 hypothetical protein [Fulvivirga sediminis]